MKTVRTWHRQENEPEHAFAIFQVYLNLKTKRSIAKAVKAYANENPVPIHDITAINYAKVFDWKKRACNYDKWVTEKQEEGLIRRLQREQVVIAKKKLLGREIVIDEALRHLKEISSRSLKTADAAELQKNIQTIRASFELLGLGELDANHQLRTMATGSGRRIRSVTAAEEPERLLELSDKSYTIQRGSLDPEALLDETDSDLSGSSRPENPDDLSSSG